MLAFDKNFNIVTFNKLSAALSTVGSKLKTGASKVKSGASKAGKQALKAGKFALKGDSKSYGKNIALRSVEGSVIGGGSGAIIGNVIGRKNAKRKADKAGLAARVEGSKGIKNKILNLIDKDRLNKLERAGRASVNTKKEIRKSTLAGLGIGAGAGASVGAGTGATETAIKRHHTNMKNYRNALQGKSPTRAQAEEVNKTVNKLQHKDSFLDKVMDKINSIPSRHPSHAAPQTNNISKGFKNKANKNSKKKGVKKVFSRTNNENTDAEVNFGIANPTSGSLTSEMARRRVDEIMRNIAARRAQEKSTDDGIRYAQQYTSQLPEDKPNVATKALKSIIDSKYGKAVKKGLSDTGSKLIDQGKTDIGSILTTLKRKLRKKLK